MKKEREGKRKGGVKGNCTEHSVGVGGAYSTLRTGKPVLAGMLRSSCALST